MAREKGEVKGGEVALTGLVFGIVTVIIAAVITAILAALAASEAVTIETAEALTVPAAFASGLIGGIAARMAKRGGLATCVAAAAFATATKLAVTAIMPGGMGLSGRDIAICAAFMVGGAIAGAFGYKHKKRRRR